MERHSDSFIRHIATERGLSEAYQLSVRRTLDALAAWMQRQSTPLQDVGTPELAAFLKQRKTDGLNAASLRITTVHLKIFFRWLAQKGDLTMDPAEPLLAPRPEQTLPETLHAGEVEKLLEIGADKAREVAVKTLERVREKIGYKPIKNRMYS